MKKIIALFIVGLLVSTPVYAGLINYDTLSSDAEISYTHLNNAFTTIYDEFNGSVETDNIKADTLTEPDFSDNINPRVRDNEIVGSFTYTGQLPVTSANLTSNISAGTSYVEGYRVVTASTSKTYTASKDTWVYIDKDGTFQYVETSLGGSQPTTPANSLLLAKVTTSSTAITAVTDLRQLVPPNLRVYTFYKQGGALSRDVSDTSVLWVTPCELELGTLGKLRTNVSDTPLDFSVTGRGGILTGETWDKGYYYIFAIEDDTTTVSFDVVASTSSSETTIATAMGVDESRIIGWCYCPSNSIVSSDSIGAYRKYGGDAPNIVKRIGTDDVSTTSASAVDMPGMDAFFVSTGRPVRIHFTAPFILDTNAPHCCLSIDSVAKGQAQTAYNATNNYISPMTLSWQGAIDAGVHKIQIRWYGGATCTQRGATDGERTLIIEEL